MKYLKGIKNSIVDRLNELEGTFIEKDKIIDENILNVICEITESLGKEIAVFIDRHGEIRGFEIGDENTVSVLNLSDRRSENSLSGIRCIHTHPNGVAKLSDVDMATLNKLKYDLMIAVAVKDGEPSGISFGWLGAEDGSAIVKTTKVYRVGEAQNIGFMSLIEKIEEERKSIKEKTRENCEEQEKAVLVGIENVESLNELEELLETSGGITVGKLTQNRDKIDKAHFIGKGKLKELSLLMQAQEANLAVFDEELTGIQVKNIEEVLGAKVIDRTQLILDIFAQRAKSKEGKLQVELAQLKYTKPRLIGMGGAMGRTGAGIGTRGPGEKKLELDRRKIRDRINDLENEIDEINKRRNTIRSNRDKNNNFLVCIVGYTNAGKSTLLNTLSDSNIYAKDQLFATLDPTTRKVTLNSGKEILITDTVGFIKKLPHDLIAAFKSTLEEVVFADLLLHVVDVSNEEWEEQYQTVNKVLADLNAGEKDTITILNKIDKIDQVHLENLTSLIKGKVTAVSAKKKIGMKELLDSIEHYSSLEDKLIEIKIPYTEGGLLSFVHNNARVIEERHDEDGTYIKCEINYMYLSKVDQYLCP